MSNRSRKVWAAVIFGMPGVLFAGLLAVGLYLLIAAGVSAVTEPAAQARVVELRRKSTTRGASGYRITVHCPTLEFVAADGATYRFEQDEGVCDAHAVGDQVTVRYDPNDPRDARIHSSSKLFAGISMTVVGGLFAYVCFFLMRRLGWRDTRSARNRAPT